MEYPMENKNRRHSRLSVGVGLFLTCLVLTTIIGLFGGLLISNYTHNNYVMYAEKAEDAFPVIPNPRSPYMKEAGSGSWTSFPACSDVPPLPCGISP